MTKARSGLVFRATTEYAHDAKTGDSATLSERHDDDWAWAVFAGGACIANGQATTRQSARRAVRAALASWIALNRRKGRR